MFQSAHWITSLKPYRFHTMLTTVALARGFLLLSSTTEFAMVADCAGLNDNLSHLDTAGTR